jgi:hypothetical protein
MPLDQISPFGTLDVGAAVGVYAGARIVPLRKSGTFLYGSNYVGPTPKIDRPKGGFFCRPFGWLRKNTGARAPHAREDRLERLAELQSPWSRTHRTNFAHHTRKVLL